MAKRASLFSKPQEAAREAVQSPPAVSAPEGAETVRRFPVASTRQGKRVATVYLEAEALKQLKQLALDEDTTIQELLVEGVNAVFEKRGRSRLG